MGSMKGRVKKWIITYLKVLVLQLNFLSGTKRSGLGCHEMEKQHSG